MSSQVNAYHTRNVPQHAPGLVAHLKITTMTANATKTFTTSPMLFVSPEDALRRIFFVSVQRR